MSKITKSSHVKILKFDDSRGIVFGWGAITTLGGQPYFDTHGDHIPDDEMINAAEAFMDGERIAKCQHEGDPIGTVLFGMPLTDDIKKSVGIECEEGGFLIGVKVTDGDTLQQIRDGELTGFSFGGTGRRTPA